MKRHWAIICIVASIVIFAFTIRIWNLTEYPPAFYADEASVGYNAYSILTTGRDEHKQLFPVFFKAFGEYKNPLLIYGLVPVIGIFGLSEFSVRLGSVIAGTATVFFMFLVLRKMFGTITGLLSSFLLAISPWHIQYSRTAFELIMFPLTYLIALFPLIFFLEKPTKIRGLGLISAFALSVYSYGSARIIMPALLILVAIRYANSFFRPVKKGVFMLIVFVILISPVIVTTINQNTSADSRVQTLSKESLQAKLKKIETTYVNHFNPTYVFLQSEMDYPGNFITRALPREISFGMSTLLPLFYGGILLLLVSKNKYAFIVVASIALYPLPGSISNYMFGSTRSILGIVLICVASAFCIQQIISFGKKTWTTSKLLPIGITLLCSTYLFAGTIYEFSNYYFKAIPKYRMYATDFWGWQYGPKPIMEYFFSQKGKYDEYLMSGEFNGAYILPLFYAHGTCPTCIVGGIELYSPRKKQLFAATPSLIESWHAMDRFQLKKTIYYPDGKIGFYIGEFGPPMSTGRSK